MSLPRRPTSSPILPLAVAAILAVSVAGLLVTRGDAAEPAVTIPPPTLDVSGKADGLETAILAGGCFWGVQAVFQHVNGVDSAVSGYAGGTPENPTYQEVSSGATGHAESVEVKFDPRIVTYGEILQVFFSVAHNPTQLDYQGPDHGTQYRSAIFTTTDDQKRIAEAYIRQLDAAKLFPAPIVTEVGPAARFYPAEDYHQDYATLHPDQGYIAYNDLPKVENLKAMFPALWRDRPKLVFAENAS